MLCCFELILYSLPDDASNSHGVLYVTPTASAKLAALTYPPVKHPHSMYVRFFNHCMLADFIFKATCLTGASTPLTASAVMCCGLDMSLKVCGWRCGNYRLADVRKGNELPAQLLLINRGSSCFNNNWCYSNLICIIGIWNN